MAILPAITAVIVVVIAAASAAVTVSAIMAVSVAHDRLQLPERIECERLFDALGTRDLKRVYVTRV